MVGLNVLLCIYGTQKEFVIQNNSFQQTDGEAITVGSPSCGAAGGDYTLGVISGNDFIYSATHSSARSPIEVVSDSTANAWARTSGIGTANMVFIEDNTFDRYTYAGGRHAVWSQEGGSYVFRHNTLINFDVDVHGQCSWYGAREWEIYENTFICEAGVNCAYPIVVRGGTGVIYNNTIVNDGTGAYDIRIWDQRLTANCTATVYPGDSECENSGIYTSGQYPLEYQLGRGTFNTLDPIYSWGNNYRGSSVTTANVEWNDGSNCDAILEPDVVLHGSGTYALVEDDRDWYFKAEKPGYTPYTYPHPLVQGDPGDTISPAPPSGLSGWKP
jgi:hypothetical protein